MAIKTLPPTAPQAEFHPHVPAQASVREFTPRALIVGTLLGVVFGASSLYLVLKVGLTVSASIPVAVISLALFRIWSQFGNKAYAICSILLGFLTVISLFAYLDWKGWRILYVCAVSVTGGLVVA